jgi:excisionase family DNA binding protein
MAGTLRPEDILTPEELAARLKVPKSWVYEKTRSRGRNQNPLPCLRLGRYIRFDWTKVVEWLTEGDGDDRRGKKRIGK